MLMEEGVTTTLGPGSKLRKNYDVLFVPVRVGRLRTCPELLIYNPEYGLPVILIV